MPSKASGTGTGLKWYLQRGHARGSVHAVRCLQGPGVSASLLLTGSASGQPCFSVLQYLPY